MNDCRRNMLGCFLVGLTLLCQIFQSVSGADGLYTFAGVKTTTGSYTGDGASVTLATFKNLECSWVNTMGEMFLADKGNFVIRKMDTSGIVNTYFGTGSSSVSGNGGAAASATGSPHMLFGDSVGNVYFTDNSNGVARVIDSNGIVSAYAGGGTLGTTATSSADNGGAATSSSFSFMSAIVVDTQGDTYILDTSHNKIKKVTTSTAILSYVGGTGSQASPDTSANNGNGGQATSAKITTPTGLFLDTANNLYFNAFSSGSVRKIALTTGIVSLVAGGTGTSGITGDGGAATSAKLYNGYSFIAGNFDGSFYYTSGSTNNIRKISTGGIISMFAGSSAGTSGYSGDGGDPTAALLYNPVHAFVYNGNLFISEYGNNVVRGSSLPTNAPVASPTMAPTTTSPTTMAPTTSTLAPTTPPSVSPSVLPTVLPTIVPSVLPTLVPTVSPSVVPTIKPTVVPTVAPSDSPTVLPSLTSAPSLVPTVLPSQEPSVLPTVVPTTLPTVSLAPSDAPTMTPTVTPTLVPTVAPSLVPTVLPTVSPTVLPTVLPTLTPTVLPTVLPTIFPTLVPTVAPSVTPTIAPTATPTSFTGAPSVTPTIMPSVGPTVSPTIVPTVGPSVTVTTAPSAAPNTVSSETPSAAPSVAAASTTPSQVPTASPTVAPTALPTEGYVEISFDTDIYLHNCTVTVLDETDETAVTMAVAETLDLADDQVTYVSQLYIGVEGSSRRMRRLTASDRHQIMMTVHVSASSRDYSNDTENMGAEFLYTKLYGKLVDAVDSDSLSGTVRQTSAVLNAAGTLYVGQVNLTVTSYSVVDHVYTFDDETAKDSEKSGLSAGAIAGIVIGCMAAVLLCLAGLWYWKGRETKKYRTVVVTTSEKLQTDKPIAAGPSSNELKV